MKLIANRVNNTHLRDILPADTSQIDMVLAAIAYGDSAADEAQDLIGHALTNKLRVNLWMRYDHTVPVSVRLLKRLLFGLQSNIFTCFIPDYFHAKVIWWKGYGAYIGSANHTDRGWMTNIEVGVFLEEDELVANGMDSELDAYFDYLADLDKSIPISEEYVKEMEHLDQLNRDAFAAAKKARKHDIWDGPSFVAKKAAINRRKDHFKSEWLSTLGILQSIQKQIEMFRPDWVTNDVPPAWQVDQFLHAFYYNHVGDGASKPYEDYYASNRFNPNSALKTELEWWKRLSSAPSNENITFYQDAPRVRELLAKEKVLLLTAEEFTELLANTHASKEHLIKVPTAVLGRPDLSHMDVQTRLPYFSALLLKERNRKGWDVRMLLHYVLYEDKPTELWERIYHAGMDPEYAISRYRLNSIAEVVGWARPEIAPPRNGRTSKALRALGFDVKVY